MLRSTQMHVNFCNLFVNPPPPGPFFVKISLKFISIVTEQSYKNLLEIMSDFSSAAELKITISSKINKLQILHDNDPKLNDKILL